MMEKFHSDGPRDTEEIASNLAGRLGPGKLVFFKGPMGAGKTFFIKALVKALGSKDDTSSPTFALVNSYDSPKGEIHHFDLYRLSDFDELIEIGFEDYLSGDALVLVEWPEIAQDDFEPDAVINFEITGDEAREISVDLR